MVDEASIQNYCSPQSSIEGVDGDLIKIFFKDELPPIGAAVAIATPDKYRAESPHYALCKRHIGAQRIEAWLPMAPAWVEAGISATPTDIPAGFALPRGNSIALDPTLIKPLADGDVPLWPKVPDWSALSGGNQPLPIGIESLDAISPVCRGGLNLIIDTSADAQSSLRLTQEIREHLDPKSSLVSTSRTEDEISLDTEQHWRINPGSELPSQIASLHIAIAMAPVLRRSSPSLAVVELPSLQPPTSDAGPAQEPTAPQGLAEIIERLGQHLVSTTDAELTSILILRISQDLPGLGDIIDTLRLGDVDATLFIDHEGRYAPRQSSSRADLDEAATKRRTVHLQTLQLIEDAHQRAALLGEQELNNAEQLALQSVDLLRPKL